MGRLSQASNESEAHHGTRATDVENAQTLVNKLDKCVKALGDKDVEIKNLRNQMRAMTDTVVRHASDLRQLHNENEELEAQLRGSKVQLDTMEGLYQSEKSLRINAQAGHKQSLHHHQGRIEYLETLAEENSVRIQNLESRCRDLEKYEKMVIAIRDAEGEKSLHKRMRRESFDEEDSGDDDVIEVVRISLA